LLCLQPARPEQQFGAALVGLVDFPAGALGKALGACNFQLLARQPDALGACRLAKPLGRGTADRAAGIGQRLRGQLGKFGVFFQRREVGAQVVEHAGRWRRRRAAGQHDEGEAGGCQQPPGGVAVGA